jgi:hypothetical protein
LGLLFRGTIIKELIGSRVKRLERELFIINLQELAGTNLLEGRAYNIFLLAEH